MPGFVYDVFLCHNSEDKPEVDTIAAYLERRGIRLWYDRYELRPGTSWRSFVGSEWPKIQTLAVFLSGSGVGDGQAFEIESLAPNARPGSQFVVPVLLPSFVDDENSIPAALEDIIYVDFRKPENKPLDQLIWAISGENPDTRSSLGNYYRSAGDLETGELRKALSKISQKGHKRIGYPRDVREHINMLFEDPENSSNIIEFYSGESISKMNHPALGHHPTGEVIWNLDHVWPKAFGYQKERFVIGDLHNIVPASVVKNAKRGAGFFSDPILDQNTKALELPASRYGDMRGTIARICLYMAVRYSGTGDEPNLNLDEEHPVIGEPHIGSLRTLLYWNRLVDVSAAERRRNSAIMEIQGNRNPFVDEPEFATKVWYPV